jgi:glycosyltransferase involved in cell wall biosynthesis
MCAYNGLPYIREAVDSVLQQTYDNWELLIGDDCSTDGTRAWLQQNFSNHPRVKLFLHVQNMGYVGNKNFLHQHASGDYITQLDNDDTAPADRLEKQVQVIVAHPEVKIVAGGFTRIDNQGAVYGKTGPATDVLIRQKPAEGYPFWFPSLMVHRSVFEEIGYFDLFFAGALGDDIYWTVRANERYAIYCLKDHLYGYRNNPNSITNDYNNVRKLIMPALLTKLFEQRQVSGADFLEMGNIEKLREIEDGLTNDKRFMAEQYRIWSAKAVDKGDFATGLKLLRQVIKLDVLNKLWPKTLFYLVRKRIKG